MPKQITMIEAPIGNPDTMRQTFDLWARQSVPKEEFIAMPLSSFELM